MFYYDNTNTNNNKTFKNVKCHPRITKNRSCLDYKLLLKLKKYGI